MISSKVDIIPSIKTDHSAIFLELEEIKLSEEELATGN